ncbi:MAG: protein translocase subunit SecD [Minisyncoccus archaeiphilus]|uniref:protein translocase subunit SecD n=1 Tax=Minisyncoccus archaeiphilus TaxID=3238481 RepID=UPI002B1B3F5C|nr:MAG: protein translocase subunit SecD [Candidatus Parcubacteria bacterium]
MSNKKLVVSSVLIVLFAVLVSIYSFPQQYNSFTRDLNQKYQTNIPEADFGDYKLGLDLKGGVHLEYKADLSNIPEREKPQVMEGLRDVIERRVNIFGVTEPIVQIYGQDRISVDLPSVDSVEQAIAWIGQTPLLEFYEEKSEEELKAAEEVRKKVQEVMDANKDNPDFDVMGEVQKIEGWKMAFALPYKKTELTGRYLKKAALVNNPTTYAPEIELQFNEEGSKIFEQLTERNVDKTIAIFLDGQSIVDTNDDGVIDNNDMYAPRVNEKIIGGKAVITGQKNIAEAKTLTQRLNQGALPVPLGEPIVQQKIGPTLGSISLTNATKAAVVGFIAIAAFLVLFYRLPGLIASFALIIYVILLMGAIKMFSATLTLAGIGGLILSLGMAVDANILIFSRMREELLNGKGVLASVKEGVKRAWPSIRDGNFTTIIVALILYIFGTSFIKAFSFALILGILISMLSAVVISNLFLQVVGKGKLSKYKGLWS